MGHLPLPLRRGIDIVCADAPAIAGVMEATINTLMHPLLAECAERSWWRESLLTDGGYPFEFTFTTAGADIRYTLEIAPPRRAPRARLAQAIALLTHLDAGPFDDEPFAFLHRLQKNGSLAFGAWLGVRHRGDATTFKIYAEVPAEGTAVAEAYVNSHVHRPVGVVNRAHTLRMIGLYPTTGEMEFYYHISELRPWEIVALMHPVALEGYCDQLLACFQLAHGRPLFQRLPGPVFGFSYTLTPGCPERPARFSLYAFAENMFGGDAGARRRLLRYCDRANLELHGYAAMSEPVAAHTGMHTAHGLFGVTIADGLAPVMSIGLRPPALRDIANG